MQKHNIGISCLLLLVVLQHITAATITWFDCPILTNTQFNLTQWNDTVHKFVNDDVAQHANIFQTNQFLFAPIDAHRLHQRHKEALLAQEWNAVKAQCAYVPLPASRNVANSTTMVHAFVKRLVPATTIEQQQDTRPSIWLLQGGPGGSSDSLEPQMLLMFQFLFAQYNVYTLDHRGVGRSSRLSCHAPQAETAGSVLGTSIDSIAELPACAKEWQQIAQATFVQHDGGATASMSTTDAAQDLADLMTLIHGSSSSNTDIYLYGISYGTYWANRFMQLITTNYQTQLEQQVKALILDGVVSPLGAKPIRTTIDQWDYWMNQVGNDLIAVNCAQDATCQSRISKLIKQQDISNFAQLVFDRVYKNQSCHASFAQTITAATLRALLGNMLVSLESRGYIVPLLFRLYRCDPDLDMGVLNYFFAVVQQRMSANTAPTCAPLSSSMLQYNIMLSEMYDASATVEEMQQLFNASAFASGMMEYPTMHQYWPTYQVAPLQFFNASFTTTKVPVLLLNGDLDAQTPLAFAKQQWAHLEAPWKQLITIPYAPHYTVLRSPVNNSKLDCGLQLVLQFVRKPGSALDTSCLQNLVPVSLNGSNNPIMNQFVFGVTDVFDGIYEAPEQDIKISLYLFIGVESATCVFAIIVICSLIYCVVQKREKQKQAQEDAQGAYQDLDNAPTTQ